MKKIFRLIVQYYLKFLTKVVLWRHQPLIVAVAGTTNKTFIKEMILEELGRGVRVRGNPKSFNTEIGLPLAVLFLPSGYSSLFRWVDILLTGTCISFFGRHFPRILVLEMGVDRKGDMEYLLSMIKPKVAIVTNINRSFPDANTTLKDIEEEMKKLVKKVPVDGRVILNGDDKRVRNLVKYAVAPVIKYGKSKDCEARIEKVNETEGGQEFILRYRGKRKLLRIERFGEHNVDALTVAKIIAAELEVLKSER